MRHLLPRGRCVSLGLAALGLTFGLGATTKPEMPKLTIGTVFPMTGVQSAFGREALRGIELGRELLAVKDQELAARLSLLTGDDLSTGKDAGAAAEKLIAERAHVLVGSLTSAGTAAVAAVGRKAQIPVVAPLASQTSLITGTPVFRSCFDESQAAALLAQFALSDLGVKQAATLRDDTLTAQLFTQKFAEAFKAGGGTIVAQEVYDLASEDFTVPLKKLESSGAKIIATPAAYQTAGALMRQAKKLNAKLTFLGDESWDTKELAKVAGAGAAGHYFVTHFADDDTDPAVQEFVTAFKAKYGRAPGVIAASTFDAFNLVAAAFKHGNSNMKGPLTQALLRTRDFAGVTGALSFTETGETRKGGIVKRTTETGAVFKTRAQPLAAALAGAAAPAAAAPGPATAVLPKPTAQP